MKRKQWGARYDALDGLEALAAVWDDECGEYAETVVDRYRKPARDEEDES